METRLVVSDYSDIIIYQVIVLYGHETNFHPKGRT
jgi:hypothetical protein